MAMDTYTREDFGRLLDMRVYPGMIEPESRVLRAFIARRGLQYDEFRFNERLGEGVLLTNPASEKDLRDWERRTKAKPDVIAWKHPDQATIIEVKEQATLEAIWQVKSYVELYARSFPSHQVRGAIVCAAMTPNARVLAGSEAVDFYVYSFTPATPLQPAAEEASL